MTKDTTNNGASKFSIGTVHNSAIGDHATVINYGNQDEKLQQQMATLSKNQRAILEKLDANQQAIIQQLDTQQIAFIEEVYRIIDMQAVATDEHSQRLEAISHHLDNLAQSTNLPPALAQQVAEIHRAVQPRMEEAGIDIRHRLKLTVPLLFPFLSYEGELEFNARQELDQIKALVQRRG